MNLLEKILKCSTDMEVDTLITEAIEKLNYNSPKIMQLGFLSNGKSTNIFKGFIPLDTRIKYSNFSLETYGMQTTDYFYEFAHFIRKNNINNTFSLIMYLEYFINNYFGLAGKTNRETIFNDIAWQSTSTDEEYFTALENNKIGDLKGKGAALCTERSALAEQILSLFGIEVYYCLGCVDLETKQESHCFNIVKRKNDYALLDYSLPVISTNLEGKIPAYYPFIGVLSNQEFEEFINAGHLKSFPNYEYIAGQKNFKSTLRTYAVGKYTLEKESFNIPK